MSALTAAQCGLEAGVTAEQVIRWVRHGHLVAFLPPGKRADDPRPGRKGYRILRADWDTFLAVHRFTGTPEPEPSPPPCTREIRQTGSDGIKRRGQRRP